MHDTLPSPRMHRAVPPALAGAGVLVAAAGAWVLRTFDPNTAASFYPQCLFYLVTGWHCPGCGITRALHALVHFDLPRALAMNPLVVVAMPLLLALALHSWTRWRVLPEPVARVLSNGYGWIAVLVAYWVLRNLPWWPFSWLAPG